MKILQKLSVTALVILLACAATAEVENSTGQNSVVDIMLSVIAPATNTIWDAYELQTEAQWKRVDDAAVITIRAFEEIKTGGSGENDNRWAAEPEWDAYSDEVIRAAEMVREAVHAEPEWDAYSDEVIRAAEMVREAVSNRDGELLLDASDTLYPPCEGCHEKFVPNYTN